MIFVKYEKYWNENPLNERIVNNQIVVRKRRIAIPCTYSDVLKIGIQGEDSELRVNRQGYAVGIRRGPRSMKFHRVLRHDE